MAARICTQCGAPLHGDTCEYCKVEYEPEKTIPSDESGVLEVTPEEYKRIRCEASVLAIPKLLRDGSRGMYDGKTIKIVPKSDNPLVRMLQEGVITKDEFLEATRKGV